MTETQLGELLQHCPTLYHMAARGSWPGIRAHGLLSTAALLDLYAVPQPRRAAIEASHRPRCEPLDRPGHDGAVVRDQKPMSDAALRRCLQDGLSPSDWYRMLNRRVFFWLTRDRLLGLLGARPYRHLEHEVLELDAAALVRSHRDAVALSPINSGSTFNLGPAPRGLGTFLPIGQYDYATRRQTRPPAHCVVELTVAHGVADILPLTKRVSVMRQTVELETIWSQ